MMSRLSFNLSRVQKQLAGSAIVLAVIWWGIGIWIQQNNETAFVVWGDQLWIFLRDTADALDPYNSVGFFNVPWARVFLIPFTLMPFLVAILSQMIIYFLALAGIIHRYAPPTTSDRKMLAMLFIALLSPLSLDTAVELNIDWLVVLGMLVPQAYSAPLILVKPQVAIGYVASFYWSMIVRWTWLTLILILVSLLIWGAWFLNIIETSQAYPLGTAVNVAPMNIIGHIPSVIIGGILLGVAFFRKSVVAGIWGGIFMVPYIASYSLLLPYTLLVTRFPRAMLLLNVAFWISFVIVAMR